MLHVQHRSPHMIITSSVGVLTISHFVRIHVRAALGQHVLEAAFALAFR